MIGACEHGMPASFGCDDCLIATLSERNASLDKECARLEAEVMEQCRINGKGSEREAALMAKVARLEAVARQALGALRSGVGPCVNPDVADAAIESLRKTLGAG